jgi:hypothetical protein
MQYLTSPATTCPRHLRLPQVMCPLPNPRSHPPSPKAPALSATSTHTHTHTHTHTTAARCVSPSLNTTTNRAFAAMHRSALCCDRAHQLTLSHEGGGAIVQRVNLLHALAVSVGTHVKSLGPLLEEHLPNGHIEPRHGFARLARLACPPLLAAWCTRSTLRRHEEHAQQPHHSHRLVLLTPALLARGAAQAPCALRRRWPISSARATTPMYPSQLPQPTGPGATRHRRPGTPLRTARRAPVHVGTRGALSVPSARPAARPAPGPRQPVRGLSSQCRLAASTVLPLSCIYSDAAR